MTTKNEVMAFWFEANEDRPVGFYAVDADQWDGGFDIRSEDGDNWENNSGEPVGGSDFELLEIMFADGPRKGEKVY